MLHSFFIFLADCIDEKFGKGSYKKNLTSIQKKCNQKCLDTSKRLKKIREKEVQNDWTQETLFQFFDCVWIQ